MTVLASKKAFQEAVEAITDILAMILSDMKLEARDDYSNIEKIEKQEYFYSENKTPDFNLEYIHCRLFSESQNSKQTPLFRVG